MRQSRRPSGLGLAAALLLAGGVAPAWARVYPAPVLADSEDDLRALYADGLLDEADLDTLLDLLASPLDLNRARASDLYDLPGVSLQLAEAVVQHRRKDGPFRDVEELLTVPGFTADLVEQVLPFAEAAPPQDRAKVPVRGRVRGRLARAFEPLESTEGSNLNSTLSVDQVGYNRLPAAWASARVEAWRWLELGAAGVAQPDVRGVAYDADHRDFDISYGETLQLARIYAAVHRVKLDAVAGSYGAGFGLGLTFDQTSRSHPHGLYPDLTVSGSEDFGAPRRLFGIGARGFNLELGPGQIDGTIFLSSVAVDLYQYDMGMAGGEVVDPDTAELESPRVYLDGQKVGYITLPNAFREDLAGANLTWRQAENAHVGATVWVARQDRSILDGVDNDWEFVSRAGQPGELGYGAVGLNGAIKLGPAELAAEWAHTLSGGDGFLLQSLVSVGWVDLDASLRRYGTDFDNPHARGLAASDEYGGMRDRDEQGLRLKVEADPRKWLGLRLAGDLWQTLSTGAWNADLYGRVAWRPNRDWTLMVFGQHRNRNLAINDRTRIYGGSDDDYNYDDSLGEDLSDAITSPDDIINRAGARNDVGVQAQTDVVKHLSLSALYKRYYEDAGLLYPNDGGLCVPWFQIGQYTWVKARYGLGKTTVLAARLRYVDDDVYGSRGDRQIESYLQVEQKLPHKVKLSLRGTLGQDLKDEAAAWDEACDRAGVPQLEGTCVLDDSDETDAILTRERPYGAVWLTAEVRF